MAVQAVARRSDGKNMPPDLPPFYRIRRGDASKLKSTFSDCVN
jgi:hypothetical protein